MRSLLPIAVMLLAFAWTYRARSSPPGSELHAGRFQLARSHSFGRKRIIAIMLFAIFMDFATRDGWWSFLDDAGSWAAIGLCFLYLDSRITDSRSWILTVRDDGIHMPVPLPLMKERFVPWSVVKSITPHDSGQYDKVWGWTMKEKGECVFVDVDGAPFLSLRFAEGSRERFLKAAYGHVNEYRGERGLEAAEIPRVSPDSYGKKMLVAVGVSVSMGAVVWFIAWLLGELQVV